ncbi:hypothetical protein DV738_g4567, partial [Chaetothyriales sp. CBS 135597]
MPNTTQIYLFGDLTVPFESDLCLLLHIKDNPLLKSFFEKVAFALREEIANLSAEQQAWLPRFTTLVDILPNLEGKIGSPVLRFALLCIHEIGLFIKYQTEGTHAYPTPDSACLLGICTGSFAAAAVASSRSLSELIPAAVEASLVAFRTALVSLQCHLDISKRDASKQCNWSAIVNLKEDEVVRLVQKFVDSNLSQQSNIKASVNDAVRSDHLPQSLKPTGKFEQSKIAIVGFSGRYPEADSNEEYWKLLHEGRDVHRQIPEDRFDWEAHYDASGKRRNTSKVQYGCFIREPGLFDARFFNMSPREAASTDPAQRLLIMATYEALEMAGFVPNRTPSSQVDRVGVFMGTTSDDWREVNSGQDVDTYFIPGGNRAFVPGRISYYFKFSGPSLSVDTACSSSFSAIHAACSYLWKGDCDTAIAGGTNILTNPDNFAGLDRGHFLSTTGNCNAFDDGANGYCRADGIGSIILKRYEDAVADNDPIYGCILGAHTNHCGSAESITRPHEGDQASVFNRILRTVNQNPLDVSYVEMHGTGTQAGDATEMNSVLSCFVPGKQRMPNHPLYLGSVKANIGHAESASGVSALIKVLLMLKNSEIPPHCGIKTKINHNYPLDLKDRNVNIAFKPTPWKSAACVGGKRVAFLNNFSAAGGNTALLLEEGPVRELKQKPDLRKTFPITLTARSAKSLERNARAMAEFLRANPDVSLAGLSYTTTARRIHHNFRLLVSGTDVKSVLESLEKKLSDLPTKPIPSVAMRPNLAFAFTGQGAIFAGVGKDLYDVDPGFRNDIDRLNSIAQLQGFPSFLPLVDGTASEEQTSDPVIAHVGHTCIQIALCNLWGRWGVRPSVVIGHSLGEFAAFYAAGVTTAADTIYLVGTRAQLLSQSCTAGTHSMVAVKASPTEIATELRRSCCEIACENQPEGTVLSGTRQEIEHITQKLEARGKKCIKLDIPYAFHSAQVEPILADFEQAARSVHFSEPSIPLLSPLLRSVVTDSETLNAAYLSRACRQTVNFKAALEAARDFNLLSDKTLWLELGPHPLCSGMVKSTLGSQISTILTLQKRSDTWTSVVTGLENLYTRGIDIDWNEYHRQHDACHQVLELPQYNWELKNYWIQYRNNFCLLKGDIPDASQAESAPVEAKPVPIITPSVQRIVEFQESTFTMIIESDINHPALGPVIQGHKVNNVALCPSSLYADMAMTVVKLLLKRKQMLTEPASFDVSNMKVEKPLVANGSTQLLRVFAQLNATDLVAALSFYSVDTKGKKLADHATCQVRVTDPTNWTEDWRGLSFLVKHRLDMLQDGVDNGATHKMKRGLVYKLFGSLVDYSDGYRGMEEVTLDSTGLEATAKIRFQAGEEGYELNPQWIDSLGHIAGFIMNGNDSVVSKDTVFVNHGWSAMKISTKFSLDKTYRTYNKMQLTSNNMYVGDTYVLDGTDVVAIFAGVKFQGVPRRVLDQLLPASRPAARTTSRIAAKPSPAAKTVSRPKVQVKSIALEKELHITKPVNASGVRLGVQSVINTRILSIIADEVGIEISELKVDAPFDEYGIDSLLSLNISSKLQEQLGLELSSSIFVECQNVGELLKKIGDEDSTGSLPLLISDSATPSSSELDDIFSEDTASTLATSDDETEGSPRGTSLDTLLSTIKAVIAEEVGVETAEINPQSSFADLGVDSLLTLNITSRLAEVMGEDASKNLLTENETLEDVEKSLTVRPQRGSAAKVRALDKSASRQQICSRPKDFNDTPPYATCHLLQGNSKTATKNLFLFPDGSGSAFSYATLSTISPSVALYALACPWQKDPWAMTKSKVTFSDLSAKFIQAIQKIQPHGPYHLGGWSAGGISAYEAAQQLAAAGEETASLVLLDSPNPVGLENPPQRMYDFFDKLDFFGMQGKAPPKWLRAHFDAFLSLLDDYKVTAWVSRAIPPPKTHIVYAKDGVVSMLKPGDPLPEIREDDPREMKWLLNDRTDFSADGWKSLVGDDTVEVGVLEGVNHFSMVNLGPMAGNLAKWIRGAMQG